MTFNQHQFLLFLSIGRRSTCMPGEDLMNWCIAQEKFCWSVLPLPSASGARFHFYFLKNVCIFYLLKKCKHRTQVIPRTSRYSIKAFKKRPSGVFFNAWRSAMIMRAKIRGRWDIWEVIGYIQRKTDFSVAYSLFSFSFLCKWSCAYYISIIIFRLEPILYIVQEKILSSLFLFFKIYYPDDSG